jgi:Icc-related predicted phosphoesterase
VEELASDKTKLDKVFSEIMLSSLQRWMDIADKRLNGTGTKCFVSAGNDDTFDMVPIIESSKCVINPEGKVLNIDENLEMISCGFANMTPWKCPRDTSEEELAKKIEVMAVKVRDMKNCVFNLHCPPYGTPLDEAPKLDERMTPVLGPGGEMQMVSTGSTSVREAIERHQPLISLHGHIHESRALFKLGRTLCANPGSEYSEGILKGFLIDISPEGITDYIITSG